MINDLPEIKEVLNNVTEETIISDECKKALDVLNGAFFDLNRTLDGCQTWMENKWTMPQATDIVHHKLAHLQPLLADIVTDIKSQWNFVSAYPETHREDRRFENLEEMYQILLDEFIGVYNIIRWVFKIAFDHFDLNVMAGLMRLQFRYNELMPQIYTLRDKSQEMPDKYDKFDRHITSWGVEGLDLDKSYG